MIEHVDNDDLNINDDDDDDIDWGSDSDSENPIEKQPTTSKIRTATLLQLETTRESIVNALSELKGFVSVKQRVDERATAELCWDDARATVDRAIEILQGKLTHVLRLSTSKPYRARVAKQILAPKRKTQKFAILICFLFVYFIYVNSSPRSV